MWAMCWVHWWMWSKLDFCSRPVKCDLALMLTNQMHLAGRISRSLACVALHYFKKKERGRCFFPNGSWHLTSCLTKLLYFCCTAFYFHSEHGLAVSATRSGGLSATRRSTTSDLSDAHQHRGLNRVQCAEVRKAASSYACMASETRGLMALVRRLGKGLVEEEAGERGWGAAGRCLFPSNTN